MKLQRYWLIWLLIAFLTSCQQADEPLGIIHFEGNIMGTYYRIKWHTEDKEIDATILQAKMLKAMQLVDQSMSSYKASSEIQQINRLVKNTPHTLSEPLSYVLQQAKVISEKTNGALDITLAPLINLWGFGPAVGINSIPTKTQIASYKAVIGNHLFDIKDQSIIKYHDAVKLDVSSIAKGYAVDEVARVLTKAGVLNFLVDIGGELRAKGRNLKKKWWRVGIEKPTLEGAVQQILVLKDVAIATSGDYLNYKKIEGKRFAHIIDPDTGYPVTHKLTSATVIHKQAIIADAYATAFLVMGEKKAMQWATKNSIAAFFIKKENNAKFSVSYTPLFQNYIAN